MNLEQDLKWLGNHQQFANFIGVIKESREACITELHEAEPNIIMQISGRILAYDELLRMTNADEVLRRHSQ